jgi:hypothetical protein
MLNMTSPNGRLRALLSLISLSALGAMSGCVPATHYERTKTALQHEQAISRQAAARIGELQQKLDEARAQAEAQEQRLLEQEKKLAASSLDNELAATARDNALGVVDQLRGGLSRAGEHLRAFSDQKQELSKALAQREAGVEGRGAPETASLIRDIALAFHQQLSLGRYELVSAESRPVLVVPLADGDELEKLEQELASLLSQFMMLHPEARLALSVDGVNPDAARARGQEVYKRLIQKGISADRLTSTDGVFAEPRAGQKPTLNVLKLQFTPAAS